MAGRLVKEHILITGGSRGIGAAIVEKCLSEGANVSFIDLEAEEGRRLLAKLNHDGQLFFIEGNVCSVEDLNNGDPDHELHADPPVRRNRHARR